MNFLQENLAGHPDRVRTIFERGGVLLNGRDKGGEYRALCPFHEDREHPSLSVSLEKALYVCRTCGAGGDAVEFHARRHGLSVEDAIRDLRGLFKLKRAVECPAQRPAGTKDFEDRDAQGELIAIHRRMDLDDGRKEFKWIQPDGSPGLGGKPVAKLPLYGSERIGTWQAGDPIIVTEGETAAAALHEQGFAAVGTVTGARATPSIAVLEALRDRDIVLWPDHDDPGRDHMRRIAEPLSGIAKTLRTFTWGKQKSDDAADFFQRGGTAGDLMRLLDELLAAAPEEERIPDAWARPGEVLLKSPAPKARFRTGIPAFDRALRGGLPTGNKTIVIQGEPDSGKSTLLLQIADEAERQGAVVAIYAPDCGRVVAAIRIGTLRGLDATKLEARDPEEVARLDAMFAKSHFFIADESEQDLEGFVADAAGYHAEKPHLLVVDSLQEAGVRPGKDPDERSRVIANVRTLLAAALGGAVATATIATSETTKASYAARNMMDRTRPIAGGAETAKIAFGASLILHLDGDPSSLEGVRAAVVKTKLGGGKPEFRLRLDPATTRLSEIDAVILDQQKAEQIEREKTDEIGKLGEQISSLLAKHESLNVSELQERLRRKRADIGCALDGLEAQGRAAWVPGPRGSHVWGLTDLELKSRGKG